MPRLGAFNSVEVAVTGTPVHLKRNVLADASTLHPSQQSRASQAIFRRRRARAIRPPQAMIRPGRPAPTTGPGTGLLASIGPVAPVAGFPTSATNTFPLALGLVKSEITELATLNVMSLLNAEDKPPPQVEHAMPKENGPVPSPLKDPVSAIRVCPGTV